MSQKEQILAHQAVLQYMDANHMSCSPRSLAQSPTLFFHPSRPQGLTLLRMIARTLGRNVTAADVDDILSYLKS